MAKMFGLEITRGKRFVAPPVRKAATPKKKTAVSVELGESGTSNFQGIINEEYNTKLQGAAGIAIFDEMRKSDGTVKAVTLATTLPIRRASWFVTPASEDEADKEIALFIEKALFEYQTITWNDLLRQALLSLALGVMLFEKVFAVKNVDGHEWIIWKKLAPRLPRTVSAWETSDGQAGIQQLRIDGTLVDIPIERLVIFVNDKEGDNWWGTSVLRAAYKHWRFKNGFYAIDAVAFERQGLGIPKAKMSDNYTPADRDRAETILKNLRAHDQSYIIEPDDITIDFMDMKGKETRDPKESIMHHNREIVKAVLAQFLELGATDSGSRALSTDQTDLFLQSLEAVAKGIADTFNKYCIPQLVDLNFDDITSYPKLEFKGIARVKAESIATAYKTLIEAKGIRSAPQDETHFREMLGLPQREEGDDDFNIPPEAVDEDAGEDIIDELGMSEYGDDIKKKLYPSKKAIEESVEGRLATASDKVLWLKRAIAFSRNDYEHENFFNIVRSVLGKRLATEQRLAFKEHNDFVPENRDFKRGLTFAEKKVDFAALQAAMDRIEKSLKDESLILFQKERERYMKELTRALNKGDIPAVKKANFKVKSAYASVLKKHFRDSFNFGKINASREMGVKTPASAKEMLKQIDLAADTIATRHVAELTADAKLSINQALQKGESVPAALAAADKRLIAQIEKKILQTADIAVAGYINTGRMATMRANWDDIHALQRSELLDQRTCNYCLSIDGRVIEKDDDFGQNTIFHSGCRGIWVEILKDETNKPPIEGIPDSLRNRFGDAVNDLIQPKTPQNKKGNTEAQREIKKRRNRRIDKQK